jgi:hypothetical protein
MILMQRGNNQPSDHTAVPLWRGEAKGDRRKKEVRKKEVSVNPLDCDSEAKASFYENHI